VKLTVEYRMKCGCVLKQTASDGPEGEGDHVHETHSRGMRALDYHAKILRYWLEVRMRDHECSLVSPDNPAGNRRQKS
jgi:hypothetical protein